MPEAVCSVWYKAVFGLRELIPISGCRGDPPTGFCPICQYTKCPYFGKFGSPYFKGYRHWGCHFSG